MYNVTTAVKIGGIETYYWEVSSVLHSMGHSIEIITGCGNYIKYDDIPIKQFQYTSRENILDLGNRFKKFGERVSFFKNSYKYLKKQRYDFFLIHKPLDFFIAYFIKKHDHKVKIIFISGGEDFYGFDKFFSKYIDFMVSVSIDNAKKIEARYKRHVSVIPNGVDIEKFKKDVTIKDTYKSKFNFKNKKILISIGRVVGWKGFQMVIDMLETEESFYYILAGDGEYLDNLKKLAKGKNVADRVLFLGSVEHSDLPNYLNIADIFIQPSIGHEAFGITIIEAMACGLPVVASRNGGIVDIVVEGGNGHLFEIGDTDQMIEKIKVCYSNKDNLSKNAIEHIKNNFTWELCATRLVREIDS
jgi:glycosyltransferase involved in cell wall biosynthesis